MPRFVVFLSIITVAILTFLFLHNKAKLILPLQHITILDYKERYPKNVVYTTALDRDYASIVAMNNGYIFKHGKVITQNSELIYQDNELYDKNNLLNYRIFQEKDLANIKNVGGTVAVISESNRENYYNWLFNVLPKVNLLINSNVNFDKIYIYNLNYAFQKNILNVFNINEDKIYSGGDKTFIQVEKILIPVISNDVTDKTAQEVIPEWVIDFLRNKFLPKEQVSSARKIFISRSKAAYRRIINENEVFSVLSKKGYVRVFLEELSVSAQAKLFSNAQEIIAMHGSGLSNIVFCKKKTKVIEIMPHSNWSNAYMNLSKQLNLKYIGIITNKDKLTQKQIILNDVNVNINDLMRFVD